MKLRSLFGGLALLVVFALALSVLLWRPVLAIYHLEAGGRDLAGAEIFRSAHPTADNPSLDRALRHFQQAVAFTPGDGYAYRRLGQAWLFAGNNDAARQALSRAVALRPHDPLAHIALGDAFSGLGDAEKAVAEYEAGRYGAARETAVADYLKVAGWRIAAGSGDVALKILQEKILAFDPNNLAALAKMAAVYDTMGQAGAAAAAPVRARLKQFATENIAVPASPALAGELAQTMIALTENGTWSRDTLLSVAGYQVWLFSTGPTAPGTEQVLQTLAKHWPQDADLLFDFGEFYHRRGDYAAAEARYRQVLALAPGFSQATLRLGMIAEARAAAEGTPAASTVGGQAEADLADRTAAAAALRVPVSQIALSANLLPAGTAVAEDRGLGAGWFYRAYLAGDGQSGLFAHASDDLVPGGHALRIDSLWRRSADPDLNLYAEYATPKFVADPGKYLVTVCYSLSRVHGGVGFVHWGQADLPGGPVPLEKTLQPTSEGWSTERFVVDGPASATPTSLLVRNWSDGSLVVTRVSISRITIKDPGQPTAP